METNEIIMNSELSELKVLFSPNGYMRNCIIDEMEKNKDIEISHGCGSRFNFFYKGMEHRLELDTYNDTYILDNNKEFKTLKEVVGSF